MLCPKCGYITFDALPSCPKCKKNWDDIPGKISGRAVMTEAPNFLGGVLRNQGENDSVVDTPEPVNDASEPVLESSGFAESELEDKGVPSSEEGGASVADVGGLDLVLDDLPATEVATPEAEIPEINIALSLDDGATEEGIVGIALELDDDNSEESSDVSPPPAPAMVIDETDEADDKLTVDLHDIDLSDLMEPGTTGEEHPEASGIEDDTDQPDLGFGSSGGGQGVPDLLGIDLSLEDDGDGLDLSLEPEVSLSGSEKEKDEIAIPDLGLSLDLDDES